MYLTLQNHVVDNSHENDIDRTRRSTRHSHRITEISKNRRQLNSSETLYDYDNTGIHTRRRSRNEEARLKEGLKLSGSPESNDKENKDNSLIRINGKIKKAKNDKEEGIGGDTKPNSEADKKIEENGKAEGKFCNILFLNKLSWCTFNNLNLGEENSKDEKQANASSESEEMQRMQTRRKNNDNRIVSEDDKYSPRRTRSHKVSGLAFFNLINFYVVKTYFFLSRKFKFIRSRESLFIEESTSKTSFKQQ